ncbi:MAG: hypothetical protein U5K30_01615 [Acidimicrobiales bacterium]|nr:hypothetical protein [Acidimicrobiales bacterium]
MDAAVGVLGGLELGDCPSEVHHQLAGRPVARLSAIDVADGLIAAAADLAEADGVRGYDAVHLAGALLVDAEVLTSADDALCGAASRRGVHIEVHPVVNALAREVEPGVSAE